jgi:hypothetical protein
MSAWLIAVFFLWLLGAAVVQIPFGARWIPNFVLTLFFPIWTLFTDPMIAFDYALYARIELEEGNYSEWLDLRVVRPRGWSGAFWNPQKRLSARFRALVALVTALRLEKRTEKIPDSVAHRILEEFVRGETAGERFQFAIAMANPLEPETAPRFLYVSKVCT